MGETAQVSSKLSMNQPQAKLVPTVEPFLILNLNCTWA